jgi:competence protein ComGC
MVHVVLFSMLNILYFYVVVVVVVSLLLLLFLPQKQYFIIMDKRKGYSYTLPRDGNCPTFLLKLKV